MYVCGGVGVWGGGGGWCVGRGVGRCACVCLCVYVGGRACVCTQLVLVQTLVDMIVLVVEILDREQRHLPTS